MQPTGMISNEIQLNDTINSALINIVNLTSPLIQNTKLKLKSILRYSRDLLTK